MSRYGDLACRTNRERMVPSCTRAVRATRQEPARYTATVIIRAADQRTAAAAARLLGSAGFRVVRERLVQSGELVIDRARFEVRVRGRSVRLTRTEFRVLLALAERPGTVVSTTELLHAGWGVDTPGGAEYLRPIVSRLRRRLGETGIKPHLIDTVRGVGYRLRPLDR